MRKHNPTIDWNDKKIPFNDERCTTWCLNSLHVAYAIPEEKGLEETLITGFSEIQAKDEQRIRVKKLSVTIGLLVRGILAAGNLLNLITTTSLLHRDANILISIV